MKKFFLTFLLFVFLILACSKKKEECRVGDINAPDTFAECEYGSGSFGQWIIDDFGLPAYEYTLDQVNDSRALWWNSANDQRRQHWHQLGNSRFTAVATNDGVLQVFVEENGYKWLNFFNESEKNYSGGFSFITYGEETWSTAYKFRPAGAKTRRIFGLGYFRTETEYQDLRIIRTTYAPYGDDPILLSDVIIENNSDSQKEIIYYEYWDVNIHQMLMMLLSSGVLDPKIPAKNEEQRSAFNRYFEQSAIIDDALNAGLIETKLKYPEAGELKIPPTDSAKEFDATPPAIFLVPLDGGGGDGFIFDQNEFFKDGSAEKPSGLSSAKIYKNNAEIGSELHSVSGLSQPLMLVHRRKLTIEGKARVQMKYGYGYLNSGNTLDFIYNYINLNENQITLTLNKWREKLAYFVPEKDYFLHRENAWHSYYLQSTSYWREYLKTHVVSQGGEYLFGHGFDGATRDYCIFSVPLTYLNPELAKEVLKFVMLTTTPDGEMAYGNYGDTVVTGVVILSKPSDLDIFFLWAMSEYLLATRDFDFLNEIVPYYKSSGVFDQPSNTTVLDHIRTAFEHLVNVVGVGEHGLIRLRTGDWSDGITWFTENPSLAEEKGESCFNTAFAAAILPWIADAIDAYDNVLAQSMREQAEKYRVAMQNQWWGEWYLRGWQGNGKPFGDDRIFLEPQVWSLIAGIPDEEKTAVLLNSIHSILDSDSPIGARIVYPPGEDIFGGLLPGTDVNGGIWHATNSLLTWAYSIYNPEYAWESFKKNTLASHAEAKPDLWYGIWSGPDSYNSPESERPGEAAAHYATALTDHPVMNMNQHANPLIAMLKLAGVTPSVEGIRFAPRLPLMRWAFNLPLTGITVTQEKVSGYYSGINDGRIKITVPIPKNVEPQEVRVYVDGTPVEFQTFNGYVSFYIEYRKNQKITWTVE
jgi:hypothetical protein